MAIAPAPGCPVTDASALLIIALGSLLIALGALPMIALGSLIIASGWLIIASGLAIGGCSNRIRHAPPSPPPPPHAAAAPCIWGWSCTLSVIAAGSARATTKPQPPATYASAQKR